MVVTPSRFTTGARELAEVLEVKLIGAKELNDLLSTVQDSLLSNFYKSYKLSEILVNVSIELITEDKHGQDTTSSVELLEHIFRFKDEVDHSLVHLIVNNLCLGLKRMGRLEEAIKNYEEALDYISFDNEEQRYLIIGNLLVSYLANDDFLKARKLCNLVNREELRRFSQEHFDYNKSKAEEGLQKLETKGGKLMYFSKTQVKK